MPALTERRHPDGMMILQSPLLSAAGFDHAFSTAIGDDGRPFDLSSPGNSPLGTPATRLRDDLQRFTSTVAPTVTLVTTRQVHGDVVVDAATAAEAQADAIACDDPGLLVAVRTADCVPILLGCRRRGAVVAIHAGWRGLVADVPAAAVRHLVADGSASDDLVAAIGPAIGVEAFEIGHEVADAFHESGLSAAVHDRIPRPHADLHAAARQRLIDAGLAPDRIDGVECCTAADRRYFSHRRDEGRTGRHLSAIRSLASPSPI